MTGDPLPKDALDRHVCDAMQPHRFSSDILLYRGSNGPEWSLSDLCRDYSCTIVFCPLCGRTL